MYLSRRELQAIYDEELKIQGNISFMHLASTYAELELGRMQAKQKIDNIYKILHDYLETDTLLALRGKKRRE